MRCAMSPIQSMIAVLFALGSAGALAQDGAQLEQQPPTGQPTSTSTQAAGEARPQAQEERAGQPPVTSKQNEVDPSARPAPETVQPQAPAEAPSQAPSQTRQ